MKNLFERALLRGVVQYYRANRCAIQLPAAGKYLGAELLPDRLFDLGEIDKSARGLIGIEKLRRRQKLAQIIAERALPGCHSARNSDRGHLLREAQRAFTRWRRSAPIAWDQFQVLR